MREAANRIFAFRLVPTTVANPCWLSRIGAVLFRILEQGSDRYFERDGNPDDIS